MAEPGSGSDALREEAEVRRELQQARKQLEQSEAKRAKLVQHLVRLINGS